MKLAMKQKGFHNFFLFALLILVAFVLPSRSKFHTNDDVRGLIAFKQAIFEDPFSRLSDWNFAHAHPCNWSSIVCSFNNDRYLVVAINLSSSALKGFLVPEIGLLSSLQQLYLNGNMLLGTIPKEIGKLKNLLVLDLSNNRFAGPIPSEIGNLGSIKKIDLHSNGLTGTVPPEVVKLKNLKELRLDRNRLTGLLASHSHVKFPTGKLKTRKGNISLCPSSQLNVGDFSYNFLIGKIPECLKYLPRSSFRGNCLHDSYAAQQRTSQQCKFLLTQPETKSVDKSKDHKHENPRQQPELVLILLITTATLVTVCVVTGIAAAINNCKRTTASRISTKRTVNHKKQNELLSDDELLKNVRRFSRQELEVACEDFSNIIGSFSDSIVYKGTVKKVQEITVISLCMLQDYWTNYLEFSFQTKVAELSRLDHQNIVKLLGYCIESEPFSRMLVLDYVSNGTLYDHLHYGEGSELSWLRRKRIIIGIANGLKYLHNDVQPPFALSQLNSNSVYLTDEFSPKIVDLECCKELIPKSKKYGNYAQNERDFHDGQREIGIQSNIFSFGVLLLEIISGRISHCKDRGSLIDWAKQYLQDSEKISKLVDPVLKNVKTEELALLCSVVSLCIQPDPLNRPSMQMINAVLEKGINLSPANTLEDSSLAWAQHLALSP